MKVVWWAGMRRSFWVMALLIVFLAAGVVIGGAVLPRAQAAAQGDLDPFDRLYYDDLPPAGEASTYVVDGQWDKNPVTYSIINCPSSLDCGTAHDIIRQAFESWDAVCGLRLDEIASNGDIQVLWASGAHGDGDPFDGPGNILAHAWSVEMPGSLAGDVHFDDAETWVANAPASIYQIHLRTVALHEFGHALGLGHSNDPTSLMWYEYGGVREIQPDDIAGIQSLYGPPSPDEGGATTPPPPPGGVTATATTTVRIRSGPGTGFSTIGRVNQGATVPVLGRNADNSWLYIDYNGLQGWVAAYLFVVTGDLNTIPVVESGGPVIPTPTPSGPQPTPDSPTGVSATATTTVRIRSGPGTNFPSVGRVTLGETVPVLGRNSGSTWLYVNSRGTQGWVAAHLFVISGDLNSVPVLYVDSQELRAGSKLRLAYIGWIGH